MTQSMMQGANGYLFSQFDKSSDTTLADIGDPSTTAPKPSIFRCTLFPTNTGVIQIYTQAKYSFIAKLWVTADATGGCKLAVNFTGTVSAIIYEVKMLDNATKAFVATSKQTASGGAVSQTGSTNLFIEVEGSIDVGGSGAGAEGVLSIQFAQQAASGTSSVLAGSFFHVNAEGI
jgi:hypothetical protein